MIWPSVCVHGIQVMAAERLPRPLIKQRGVGGGGVVEHLSTAITLAPLIQFQKFF